MDDYKLLTDPDGHRNNLYKQRVDSLTPEQLEEEYVKMRVVMDRLPQHIKAAARAHKKNPKKYY